MRGGTASAAAISLIRARRAARISPMDVARPATSSRNESGTGDEGPPVSRPAGAAAAKNAIAPSAREHRVRRLIVTFMGRDYPIYGMGPAPPLR